MLHRAGLFEPPPVMLAQVQDWIVSVFASAVRNFILRSGEIPAAWGKTLTAASTRAIKGLGVLKLRVDISHWKYVRPEDQKLLTNTAWQEIECHAMGVDKPRSGGAWRAPLKRLTIDFPAYDTPVFQQALGDVELYHAQVRRLLAVAEHELIHVGQDLLQFIKGLKERAGLPSKHIRDALPEDEGSNFPDHALRNMEFYALLATTLKQFFGQTRNMSSEEKKKYLTAFIGVHGEPTNHSFKWWKRDSFGKWQKAVKEFLKEVETRGILY